MRNLSLIISMLLVLVTVNDAKLQAQGTFTANFDDGLVPPNTAVFGSAVVEKAGGANGSGALKLTKAVNSLQGSFLMEDLDGGLPVYGFKASFKVRVGGGTSTAADGFSFNFADNLPDGPFGEEGAGSGLTVAFDTYDNTGGEAPAIDLKMGGQVLVSKLVPISLLRTGTNFASVTIDLDPAGNLDLVYNDSVIYTNQPVPGFVSLTGGRFGFGARTGGLNDNHFIDDLNITTLRTSAVGIVTPPTNIRALEGKSATFTVQVNNTEGVTYQWFKNGAPIPGETSEIYVTPALTPADSGSKFKVEAKGPNNTAVSDEVLLEVVSIESPVNPKISFNFDDALLPANTTVYGSALVDATGGVNDTGVLKLTLNENSLSGSFIIQDVDGGAPIYGFTAAFKARVGGGTTPPADGFSFNFANDLPDGTFAGGEEGAGSGLVVAFDVYNNGGGEAPAIDVKFSGQVVASTKVALSLLETGDAFVDVLIGLKTDGTLDLAYNNNVVYYNLPVPGFGSIAGGRFAVAARTGGLNANHFIDDIRISTVLTPGALRFTQQPKSQTVLAGKSATFVAAVNDPAAASYQWLKNGAPIPGAISATYTTPLTTATDDKAQFKVQVTGPNTVVSDDATLRVLVLSAPANPKVNFDFDNGLLPANTRVYGNAAVGSTGGVNGSGVLKLTEAQNSQSGIFLVQPLEGGAEVSGFVASFDVQVGAGTVPPADGFSFNFARNLPNAPIGEAENGGGTGLTVAFDVFDNGGGEAPSVDIRYGGSVLAVNKVPLQSLETGEAFVPVLIRLESDGTVDAVYNDLVLYHDFTLPGFAPIGNGRFGFAARTGGLNANHFIDNLKIDTTRALGPLRITTQPLNTAVLEGKPAALSLLVSDPTDVSYQWFRNGTTIAGATSASYTTGPLALADDGARFKVQASRPGTNVLSDEVVVNVLRIAPPANPKAAFNFNDGAIPPNSSVVGSAFIDTSSGVNDSGVLKLTTAENSLQGSFFIGDLDSGALVGGFTAAFKVRMGGGTTPPADGMSFVWADDLPDSAFGEEGIGGGLIVAFDNYDNLNGEAPAVDVRFAGNDVATRKVPIALLRTDDAFVQAFIRLEPDGTLDVVYGDTVMYYNLSLPGFAPIAGARFGFGARTGGLNENQFVDDLFILTVPPQAPAPQFTRIKLENGKVTLEWTGEGTLQSGATVQGPWIDIPGAVSPRTVTPGSELMLFFRIKR